MPASTYLELCEHVIGALRPMLTEGRHLSITSTPHPDGAMVIGLVSPDGVYELRLDAVALEDALASWRRAMALGRTAGWPLTVEGVRR